MSWRRRYHERESNQDLAFVFAMMADDDDGEDQDLAARLFYCSSKDDKETKQQQTLSPNPPPPASKKRKNSSSHHHRDNKTVRFPQASECHLVHLLPSVQDMTQAEFQSTWFSPLEIQQIKQQQQQQQATTIATSWERQEQRQCARRVVLEQQAVSRVLGISDDAAAERIRQASIKVTAKCTRKALARARQENSKTTSTTTLPYGNNRRSLLNRSGSSSWSLQSMAVTSSRRL